MNIPRIGVIGTACRDDRWNGLHPGIKKYSGGLFLYDGISRFFRAGQSGCEIRKRNRRDYIWQTDRNVFRGSMAFAVRRAWSMTFIDKQESR